MRLMPKLTLGILAASAIPLGIAGLSGARLSETALRRRIEADHATLARNAADGVARFFDGLRGALAIYPQLVDLEAASPELATGVLRLVYRSGEDVAIVALVGERGEPRVEPVYAPDAATARELGDRPGAAAADPGAFLAR